MTIALALIFGVAIGVLLGLLGGGGSILAVPALVYGLGFDFTEAVPVSLIVIASASAFGAVPKVRAGQVQWRLAAIFSVVGIPSTFLGAALGRSLPHPVLMFGFAAVMVAAGARMLTDRGDIGTACTTTDSGVDWRRCAPRSVTAGLFVGVLTGLFGVGGGFLIVPALVLVLGIEMPVAIGTSLVIIVVNSLSGLASHLSGSSIDWAVTAAFAGSAIVASLLAGRLGGRTDTRRLQRWFAFLVFGVAAYIVVQTVAEVM